MSLFSITGGSPTWPRGKGVSSRPSSSSSGIAGGLLVGPREFEPRLTLAVAPIPVPTLVAKPARAAKRVSKRARLAATQPTVDPPEEYLKRRRVGVATRQNYLAAVTSFEADSNISISDPNVSLARIDTLLDHYLSKLFFNGEGIFAARTTLYGVAYVKNIIVRKTDSLMMSRCTLEGFRREDPDISRDPCPWMAACLVARHLVTLGPQGIDAAAMVLIQADTYARPREVLELEYQHILPPRGPVPFTTVNFFPSTEGKFAKNRSQDDAVTVGNVDPARAFVAPIVLALKRRARLHGVRLVSLTLPQYEKLVKTAVAACQLAPLKITPHCFRHLGPSEDVLHSRLEMALVQQRGRWMASSSVLRYQKQGRLLRQHALMSSDHIADAVTALAFLKRRLVALIV
jgi:hypothetical protein